MDNNSKKWTDTQFCGPNDGHVDKQLLYIGYDKKKAAI